MYNGVVDLDMFWNEEKNGGKIEDIIQTINDTKYYWMCLGCFRSYQATVYEFLDKAKKEHSSQAMIMCDNCKKVGFIRNNGILGIFSKSEYSRTPTRELEIDTTCSICGHRGVIKYRSVKGTNSFVCMNCRQLYNREQRGDLPKEIEPYWSNKNRHSFENTEVLMGSQPFWLICPRCGKVHQKGYRSLKISGAYCEQCSRSISAVEKSGSLKKMFPVQSVMWDKGNNKISSDSVSIHADLKGTFVCNGINNDLPDHSFVATVSNVVACWKQGNLGCPVCAGKKIVRGVNDFESRYPQFAKYWDYELNDEKPWEVNYNSEKNYHFICDKGHKFMRDPCHMRRGMSGNGCPVCRGRRIIEGSNDLLSQRPDVAGNWVSELNDLAVNEVTVRSNQYAYFKCSSKRCNNIFREKICAVTSTNGLCPDCRNRTYSDAEKDLAEYIKNLGFNIVTNSKLTGNSQTFDIYVPERKLAIEYNGLYWHSERNGSGKDYHFDKLADCAKLGIRLIYIWDDLYTNHPRMVERYLRKELGVDKLKINFNECTIQYIDTDTATEFLEENSMLGYRTALSHLGMYYNGNIEGLLSFNMYNNGVCEIVQYSDIHYIIGGLSGALKYILSKNNINTFYAVSDNTISNGKEFKDSGFEFIEALEPDYYLYSNGNRLLREEVSEYEEYGEKSIRIYDAGKLKWRKSVREENA